MPNLIFNVEVNANPPATFQWLKGNDPNPNNRSILIGKTDKTLVIENASISDDNYYSCRISNSFGTVYSRLAHGIIWKTPSIITQPVPSISISLLQTLVLSVSATGIPSTLSYQWFKDSTPLSGPRISGENTSTLTITQYQSGDAGSYHVVVTNQAGSVSSNNSIVSTTVSGHAFDAPNFHQTDFQVSSLSEISWSSLSNCRWIIII